MARPNARFRLKHFLAEGKARHRKIHHHEDNHQAPGRGGRQEHRTLLFLQCPGSTIGAVRRRLVSDRVASTVQQSLRTLGNHKSSTDRCRLCARTNMVDLAASWFLQRRCAGVGTGEDYPRSRCIRRRRCEQEVRNMIDFARNLARFCPSQKTCRWKIPISSDCM